MSDTLTVKMRRTVPAMWVVVGLFIVAAVGDIIAWTSTDFETFEFGLAISVIGLLVGSVAFIVAGILFVGWALAARRALEALGGQFTRGSGQLIWWFIVPIANLFMPKKAYDELAEMAGGGPATAAVGAWWSTWLGYVVASYVAGIVANTTIDFAVDTLLSVTIAVLLLVSAVRAKNMMATINAAVQLKAPGVQQLG